MIAITEEAIPSFLSVDIPKVTEGDFVAILDFVDIVDKISEKHARQFACIKSFNYDVLIQAGRISALRAVNQWPNSSGNIEGYVRKAIKNGILKECREFKRISKHEIFISSGDCKGRLNWTAIDRGVIHDGFGQIDREDALPSIKRKVQEWLADFPEQKRKVINLIFYQDFNQSQTSDTIGLSRARVGQIVKEVLESGRTVLADLA